jgi:hypothetical protein
VDFAEVPPPAFYFYADALALRLDQPNHMAHLYFGRTRAGAREFSDSVEIVVPEANLFLAFWSSTRDVEHAIDTVLAGVTTPITTCVIDAPQAAKPSFFANMIFIAVGMGEVSLDFYHLPPRDIHLVKTERTDEMALVPCLRIMLSVLSAKAFFSMLRPHTEERRQSVLTGETRNEPAIHTS